MEETPDQMEWTTLGSSSVLLRAEWSAEKVDPRLFLKNWSTDRVNCYMKKAPVNPSKLHSVCSWVSSIGNESWMERKLLQMAENGLPKTPSWWWSQSTSHSKSILKSILGFWF